MSQAVGKSLQDLAYALRQERIAFLTYQGDSWDVDGIEYILASKSAREAFEVSLNQFVEVLANA